MRISHFLKNSFYIIIISFIFFGCKKEEPKVPKPKAPNLVILEAKEPASSIINILGGYKVYTLSITGEPIRLEKMAKVKYISGIDDYGFPAPVDFRVNTDNSLDILWSEIIPGATFVTAPNKNSEFAQLKSYRRLIRANIPPTGTEATGSPITVPNIINTGHELFFGFEKLDQNTFVIGYSGGTSPGKKYNGFHFDHYGAFYTAFDMAGNVKYTTQTIGFSDPNNHLSPKNMDVLKNGTNSKGLPIFIGALAYSSINGVLGVFVGHEEHMGNFRHQAGLGLFLNPKDGDILSIDFPDKDKDFYDDGNRAFRPIPKYKKIWPKGEMGWYISHNLDGRLLTSKSGDFYFISHGDANPRALSIKAINIELDIKKKPSKDVSFDFYQIAKATDVNKNITLTKLGDATELSNGDLAVCFSTKNEGRKAYNLQVRIIKGLPTAKTDKDVSISSQIWITNSAEEVGWGSKILALPGDRLLIAWNTFIIKDKVFQEDNVLSASYVAVLDPSGKLLSKITKLPTACLPPTQSIRLSNDKKKVFWVSPAPDGNKLNIHSLDVDFLTK